MKKLLKNLMRRITHNYTEIPMCYVTFDYQKYNKGIEKNCTYHVHPKLQNDEYLKKLMFSAIDYIRGNYDMKDFVRGINFE